MGCCCLLFIFSFFSFACLFLGWLVGFGGGGGGGGGGGSFFVLVVLF